MSKTGVIIGDGPGVSTAVAERFGAEGFSIARAARGEAKLAAGVEALKAQGHRGRRHPGGRVRPGRRSAPPSPRPTPRSAPSAPSTGTPTAAMISATS